MLRLVGGLLCRGLLHVPSLLSWLLGRAASLPAGLQLQLLPVLHLMLRVSGDLCWPTLLPQQGGMATIAKWGLAAACGGLLLGGSPLLCMCTPAAHMDNGA